MDGLGGVDGRRPVMVEDGVETSLSSSSSPSASLSSSLLSLSSSSSSLSAVPTDRDLLRKEGMIEGNNEDGNMKRKVEKKDTGRKEIVEEAVNERMCGEPKDVAKCITEDLSSSMVGDAIMEWTKRIDETCENSRNLQGRSNMDVKECVAQIKEGITFLVGRCNRLEEIGNSHLSNLRNSEFVSDLWLNVAEEEIARLKEQIRVMDEERQDTERRELERKEKERKETERKEIERKETERKELERKEIEKKETEWKELERKDTAKKKMERKEMEGKETGWEEVIALGRILDLSEGCKTEGMNGPGRKERKKMKRKEEIERKESERMESEKRETERKELEGKEMERKELVRRKMDGKEKERRDVERKKVMERKEMERKETERMETEYMWKKKGRRFWTLRENTPHPSSFSGRVREASVVLGVGRKDFVDPPSREEFPPLPPCDGGMKDGNGRMAGPHIVRDVRVVFPVKETRNARMAFPVMSGSEADWKVVARRNRCGSGAEDGPSSPPSPRRSFRKRELIVAGFYETEGIGEIMEALCYAGGCPEEDIRMGPIRTRNNGLSTVWVQLPMAAALLAAEKGRILIGRTVARVELLKVRPLQCFKCWAFGHRQDTCRSVANRLGACYKCGQTGHFVRECVNLAHCAVCFDSGKKAHHRLGGPLCMAQERHRELVPGRRFG